MSLNPSTWHLDDFSGGIDTRDGTFSRRQNSFKELTNYVITNGKKIRRRWPYVGGDVSLPTPSKGLLGLGNALRTVQRNAEVADIEGTVSEQASRALDKVVSSFLGTGKRTDGITFTFTRAYTVAEGGPDFEWSGTVTGLDVPGNYSIRLYVTSDVDYQVDSFNPADNGAWTRTIAMLGRGTKIGRLIRNSDNKIMAEVYPNRGLVRSYNVPETDTLLYHILNDRCFSYDQAVCLCAAVAHGEAALSDTLCAGLMSLQTPAGFAGPGEFAFSYPINAWDDTNEWIPYVDPYFRTGAQAWIGYALAFYVEKFPSGTHATAARAAVVRLIDALIARYWHDGDLATDYRVGAFLGGAGQYSLPDYLTFTASYTIPWVSTEHSIDCWHMLDIAVRLGFSSAAGNNYTTYRDAIQAKLLGASNDETIRGLWWEEGNRAHQGISDATNFDTAHALDCGSWYAVFAAAVGEIARADVSLRTTDPYIVTDVDTGATGYTPYKAELGYPGTTGALWIEGTAGVALANLALGYQTPAMEILRQAQLLERDDGYPYVNIDITPYELRAWQSAASTGWIALAGYPNNFWSVRGVTTDVDNVGGMGFDSPDNAIDDDESWELVDAVVYEDKILALIRHVYPNGSYPSVVRLHVLGDDPLLPTYVEDPACPSNWSGGMDDQPNEASYVEDWNPRLVVNQGKVYIGGPKGDIHFCKTGNPRAWNVLTLTQLSELGQSIAFVLPDGAALKSWVLAEAYEDFQLSAMTDKLRFTAYVLEWWDEATKTWTLIREVGAEPNSDKTFRLRSVTHRKGGTKPETQIQLYWTGDTAPIIRFRMILAERTDVLSGTGVTYDAPNLRAVVASGTVSITKDGATTEHAHDGIASEQLGLLASWALVDDVGETQAWGAITKSTARWTQSPPTGYERWRSHVVAYVQLATTGTYPNAEMSIDEPWQVVRKLALAEYAGANDAGVLNSSAHTGAGGGQLTAIAVIRQRLLAFYAASSQLWQVGPLAADHELIDTGLVGTGRQASPDPAPLEDSVVIATPQGLRQFSIESLQEAYIRELGIGDQLKKLLPTGEVPTQMAACYWPWTGEYVTAVELGGEAFILGFDYAPASEIGGWSKWTMRGFTSPLRKHMVAIDDKLYIRQGDEVHRWDASLQTYRDVGDTPDLAAFESKAVWHFNDFKQPATIKLARHIDVAQVGTGYFSLRYQPANPVWETAAVRIRGNTLGNGKVPFIATGPALALVLTSTDESGHELESVAIEYLPRRR